MGQQTYSSGSGSWTVPDGVTSITLLLIGGGGGGASAGGGGGGGGGGSISRTSYSVTPFASISYSVGAGGGPDSNGGNTTFGALTAGGGAGAFSSSTGGAGGTGDFTGGAGGSQISVPDGGGGGGSGGRSANGNAGANSNAGSAGGAAVSEGGAGGAGAVGAGEPSNGSAPGGGGGGSNAMTVGGSGAAGFIQIDWDDEGGAGSGIYWADAFMTFRNVSVPKRATINKAFVRFTAKSGGGITNAEDTVEAMIFGNDVDDSSPPTDNSTYTAKALTDSCQSWETIGHWTDEATYDSPDVACIIQEIVDRSGWASGNDISLYVQNNFSTEQSLHYIARRAYDYGTDSAKAPELFIYYSLEESGSGGVVVGGAVTSTIIRSETASGGVVVGGIGSIVSLKSETGSGGVVISGTAIVAGGTILYVEVASGGVVVGGTGQPIYSEIASGGMVCGGSADNAHISVVVASGGVVVTGARWRYRRQLIVAAGRVAEYLDKFYLPVAVQLDPTKASSSVMFTDYRGLNYPLAFEIREYDATTGKLWAYVKTPLKSNADNILYIYYGDESA